MTVSETQDLRKAILLLQERFLDVQKSLVTTEDAETTSYEECIKKMTVAYGRLLGMVEFFFDRLEVKSFLEEK